MRKGIALQFRQAYPENYGAYRKACLRGEVEPGRLFVYRTGKLMSPRFIINFPTKRHWKGKAKLADVEAGLADLIRVVREEGIMSIAVPPLGCGNGGLDWDVVRSLIEAAFEPLPEVRVLLYAPEGAPDPDKMKVATKRPKMTPGKAAISGLLENYSIPGYRLAARLALKALRAGAVEAGLHLPLGAAAIRTLMHVKAYTIVRPDLVAPLVN